MKLTEPQRKALSFLATVSYAIPSQIGEAMGGSKRGVAQGLGRMGGAMAARLQRLGLVCDASRNRSGFPAYSISRAGRAEVDAAREGRDGQNLG